MPRVWPSFTLSLTAPLAAQLVGGVAAAIALIAMLIADPGLLEGLVVDPTAVELPVALTVGVVVVTMGCLAGFTLAAGYASPEPLRARLGLVRGHLRWTTLVPASLFAVSLGLLSGSAVLAVFGEPAFDFMNPMMGALEDAGPLQVGAMALAIGIGPGVAEELLFRGYLQRRLLQRWSPAVAVTVASLVFAASHLHPIHILTVTPLALWLGVLGWRSGSVVPGVVVHTVNNVMAIVLTTVLPDEPTWLVAVSGTTLVASGLWMAVTEPALRPGGVVNRTGWAGDAATAGPR